ncbi:MAG: GNAT family N-acetyltransferase [Rhodobacteraceae bacterium]|nr:GNAT family N-acetyltransferase [Paracoccaceae bacterium]
MALPLPHALNHPALPGLHLRRLRADDAAPFHAAVTTPAIGRMLFMFPAEWSLPDAHEFIAAHAPRERAPLRLAIAAGNGGFLGSIGLVGEAGNEIAYFLTAQAQGQGVMRAALAGFIDLVFAQFGARDLRAAVYHDNPASMHLLRSLGFVETGRAEGACSAQRAGAEMLHHFALRCGDQP